MPTPNTITAIHLVQLQAGLALHDAFSRWTRDATAETHKRPAGRPVPSLGKEKVQ